MHKEQTIRPMPRLFFDMMSLSFRIRDLLKNPHKVLTPVGLRPGMTVVDYGCGPGSYTIAAAQIIGASGKIYGVDVHPQAIKSVQRKARAQGMKHVEALLADGYDSGVPANGADCVLLMDIIHMVSDPNALLAEVRRILKPDGFVYVQVHHIAPEQAKTMLQKGQFSISKHDGMDIWASSKT
ncbi:MAG: class I SAM-dependent methyltransferase [Anaerolineae bacterium]|nr:class I SAM-dependent methyltransferase [Anaerolineae bacterium]